MNPGDRVPWRLILVLSLPTLALGVFIFSYVGWSLPRTYDSQRLHALADPGDVRGMAELLDREPGRLNQRNRIDMTPLHLAAYRGRAGSLDELIRRGADVNARWNMVSSDDGEWTALHVAAVYGDAACVRTLLRGGAEADARTKRGLTALDLARLHQNGEVVDDLFDAGKARAAGGHGPSP